MFLCLILVVINLEMIRRATYEVVFHHAAFLTARFRVLGKNSAEARGFGLEFVGNALGEHVSRDARERPIDEKWFREALESRWHFRYPAYLRFPYGGRIKHHFEVTKECKFPYS